MAFASCKSSGSEYNAPVIGVVEVVMRRTSLVRRFLCFGLCFLLFAVSARPQIPAPLARCGPHPTDPADWPRNPSLEQPAEAVNLSKIPAQDKTQLQHDAKELADLSASLPGDIEQVNRGVLPKDVVGKLKRIEKISRRLRGELTQ
jgi:hypothetical protein